MRSPQSSNRRNNREPASQQKFDFQVLEERRLLSADFLVNISDGTPVEDRISQLRDHLELDRNESLDLISLERDQLGFAHFKYQLHHNGVPVEHSVYTVHSQNGEIERLSGNYIEIDSLVARPSVAINESVALQGALDHVDAELYSWQEPGFNESMGVDPGQPEGKLLYYRTADDETKLTYKFDVFSIEPFERSFIYVDALNGTDIVGTEERFHSADEPGIGTTLYNGIVPLTVDSFDPGTGVFEYRLREGVAGNPFERPITTRDAGGTTNTATATDYVSATTVFSDPSLQNGAQIHYGAEASYDYFLFVHGRDSYDDNGAEIRSFGNYRRFWNNAAWTGSSLVFGDGDGIEYNPLTSLVIVGHELTHGVVENSANLRYQFQSGALNESFADIFGVGVERFATGIADWELGDEISVSGDAFRSLADPNAHGDPDTFMGDFWHPSSNPDDNGGVHTNSGVQNKWFYILTNGESGTNDLGWDYDVRGVGFDAAAAIAYRNLTVYLTPDSGYAEARLGAIHSAIDIFGEGSQEHLSTEDAWFAVGLDGPPEIEPVSLDDAFRAERPLGSQIYKASVTGTVVAQPDDLTDAAARMIYHVDLDANQTLAAIARGTDGVFEPVVRIQDPSGTILSEGTSYGEIGVTQAVQAFGPSPGTYTIVVSGGESGTLGEFELDVYLNTDIEDEPYSLIPNDSVFEAQYIAWTSVPLGSGTADRIAVTGSLSANDISSTGGGGGGDVNIYHSDDFESGVFDIDWTIASTGTGRIRISDQFGSGAGLNALIMDSSVNQVYGLNEAIWEVNLSGVPTPHLNFDYMEHFDETDPLPAVYTGSVEADGVSISDDGITWYTIQNALQSPADEWNRASYNLTQFANDTGLDISGEIFVKFQQYDNQEIEVADGRGFDEVSITDAPFDGSTNNEPGVGDWYVFEVGEFESVSLVVAGENGGGDYDIELYDPAGDLVVSEPVVDSQNVNGFIPQYQNTILNDGDPSFYYAKVLGDIGNYNLIVTRDSIFNVESTMPVDNELTLVDGGMGYISSSDPTIVEPDDFEDNLFDPVVVDTIFPDVTFSNAITGGSVFVEDVFLNDVFAPTLSNVFTPEYDTVFNWDEGVNELRVDFAEPQLFVSFDSRADDTNQAGLDQMRIQAFDSEGTMIDEEISSSYNRFDLTTVTLTRPQADIAYVIATGVNGDAVLLDNFQYGTGGDTDVFQITAVAGEEISFGGFIPGRGPGEFDNRLYTPSGGTSLRLELIDPNGTAIDSGSFFVESTAEMDGVYEIHVTSEGASGEYYLGRNPQVPLVGIDFGIVGSPIYQDYTPVFTNPYSASRGFGWTNLDNTRFFTLQRGDALVRDVARLFDGDFDIDVPNGTYDVTVHLGFVNRPDIQRITLEGIDDIFQPNGGININRDYTVSVTDSQLNFQFSGQGGLNPDIQISGISFFRVGSSNRSVPSEGSSLFANQWDQGDTVMGARVETDGVREVRKNVDVTTQGLTLMGSQKLAEANVERDSSFASFESRAKTEFNLIDDQAIDTLIRF